MNKIVVDPLQMGIALAEFHRFQFKTLDKVSELVTILCQTGVKVASDKIISYRAIDTGDLDSSIYYGISSDGESGFIRADNDHAVYVEFGTGICRDKNGYRKHPKARRFGYKYDINHHRKKGWYYFDKNKRKVRWTRGMSSRPFMYETAIELKDSASEIARGVFGND